MAMPSARPASWTISWTVRSPRSYHSLTACIVTGRPSVSPGCTGRRAVGRRHADAAQHRGRAGNRLEAADIAAAADLAVFGDDDVADLAGAEQVAVEQLALDDDASADTLLALDEDEVVAGARPAEVVLGHGRGLAVVQHVHRQAIARLEQIAQRQIEPVEVDGPVDLVALPHIDQARRADAKSQERKPRAWSR